MTIRPDGIEDRPRLLLLLCGPAFSGKSTLARGLTARHGARIVSLDAIQAGEALWGGDGLSPAEWERAHREALDRVDAHLKDGAPLVAVDDTLCYRFLRNDYRAIARRHVYEVRLVVLRIPEDEIRRRMRENEEIPVRRGLRPEVFEEHLASFEWPSEEEEPHDLLRTEEAAVRFAENLRP